MYYRPRRATFLLTVCIVYIVDIFLSGTFFGWTKSYAAPTSTDIISVFVDKKVSGSFDLERFTNSYIGRNYDNAKVIVFQIDPSWVWPAEMVKINQNLYLEWTKDWPSRLVGTILIGDIDLPMVNKQWFIFPTVYPLVDFDQPKYYYNPLSDYFEYQSEGNSQPEIWHSIIDFDDDLKLYGEYIDKLKEYAKDPTRRVGEGMRYEDILHQKQTLIADNFPKYINSSLFSEDVMYNRYTNLMIDVFNALHNSGVVDILGQYNDVWKTTFDDEYYNDPAFQEVKSNYSKEIKKFWNLMKSLKKIIGSNSATSNDIEPSPSSLWDLPNSKYINTLFLQKVVEWFMKTYLEMYGTSYFDTKEKRTLLWWRYVNISPIINSNTSTGSTGSTITNSGLYNWFVDDHITLATKRDEVSKQLMIDINTKLEKAVDDKIQQEWYSMNVLVPTRVNPEKKKVYEIYYFWLPAELITDAMEFSIYRGTFNNIRSLKKLTTFDFTDWMDYSSFQSVGATRGENAREVEAHRGYDFSLVEYDQSEFDRVKETQPYKKIRKRDRRNLDKMIWYYRAWYTPFNIDQNSDDLRLNIWRMDYTQLRNPFKDRSLWWGVFDIAWSRITTSDRVVGFTLWSNDEDGEGGDDDEWSTNKKSYSWYSDSFLGMDFFWSAIQVTRNNGKRLKFRNRLWKYRYRKKGKPRMTDRSDLSLRNLGELSKYDGLFLLPNGKLYTDKSDYITLQPESDDHHDRYFKSVNSVYHHISPTLEELYGEYINLYQVNTWASFNCSEIEPDENEDLIESCTWFSFPFTSIYPWTVPTQLYAKQEVDYTLKGSNIYFNNSAVREEHGAIVDLNNAVWVISKSTLVVQKYNIDWSVKDTYTIPWWWEYSYDCSLHNAEKIEEEEDTRQCKWMTFMINSRTMPPLGEQYFWLYDSGSRIVFYSWASVQFQWKSIDLGWLTAIVDPDTKIATFTGRKLQVWWINEFTLERPIDSPRYINFQWIGWDKVTWLYPNIWKVPVFKEVEWNKVLMNQSEIKISIKQYLKNLVNKYNDDLTKQYANRFSYYQEKSSPNAYPRSHWIDILAPYDWTLSPMVQSDNTGLFLRSYKFLPEDYLIDQLATTWNKKEVTSNDMVDILAEQLYYQNVMWQELPLNVTRDILQELWFYQSFADSNHKARTMLNEYIITQPTNYLDNSNSLSLKYPYYQSTGYEIGYINSDWSDYMQLDSLPPLISLIQKQQTTTSDGGKKTKEQLSSTRCGNKIPPSYIVSLNKRPSAIKCRWEEVSNTPFELSISFNGSANGISFDSLGKSLEDSIATPYRNQRSWYTQERRSLVKDKDDGLKPEEYKNLYKKLDNLTIKVDSLLPQLNSQIKVTLSPKGNIGNYIVQVLTTGSNCLLTSQGSSLCQNNGISLPIRGKEILNQTYILDPNRSHGVGDMLLQFKVCAWSQCVYRSLVLTVQPWPIHTFSFITPLWSRILPIARWNVFPLVVLWYDDKGNKIGTTPYDFSISTTHQWWLIYQNQLKGQHEINSFIDAWLLYDSFTTRWDNDTIIIKPLTNLTNAKQELQLEVVDPEVKLSINKDVFTLPDNNDELVLQKDGYSKINLDILPILTIDINNSKPIYSLIDIKSLWGKFIPWIKKSVKRWSTTIDNFQPLDELLFTGWVAQIYLYPTMSAWDDIIEVKVWNVIQSLPVKIKPWKPYKTIIKFDKSVIDIQWSLNGTIAVTDIRWNILYDTTDVLLGVFGNLTIDGISGSGSTISVVGEQSLTVRPQYPWWQWYIFSTLPSLPFDKQIPDYQSILIQNRSRPIEQLSIAYLNLYGSNRSEQKDSKTQSSITTSLLTKKSKTLAITTQINDPSKIFKSLLMMTTDGNLLSLDGWNTTWWSYPITVLWWVSWYNTPYGRLPFGDSFDILIEKWKRSIDGSKYQVVIKKIWQWGSFWLFLQMIDQSLNDYDKQIPSIQNSDDPHYNIGFGDTFKPMTNFAQGQSVGQSSIWFASEYVINLGDPTYRQWETNRIIDHTTYDGGVGESIYTDPGKIIDQVMDIDWDKSWNKDLLIVYSDGWLRLLIARWEHDYQPIGDIAYIYDGIKKVYVGDGDGDGFQDIFVETLSRQLRFYKNYKWERVDVDGYPLCLDLTPKQDIWSGTDQATDFGNVYQRMLTDPNNDKVTDIVVLDRSNTIRLFEWWWGDGWLLGIWWGGYFISRDKLGCDSARRERQKGHSTVIKSFAPQVNGQSIKDDSLVHRKGFTPSVETTTQSTDDSNNSDDDEPDKVVFSPRLLDMPKKPWAQDIKNFVNNFNNQLKKVTNPTTLLNEYMHSLENTVILWWSYRPSYELWTGDEILYRSLNALLPTDKVDVSKTFTDLNGDRLEDGDIVKIDITITNKWSSKVTYIEKLLGPWDVPLSGGKQVWFYPGTLWSDYEFILSPWPSYIFMIDNITLWWSVSFGYHVVYKSQQLVTIRHGEDFISKNGIGWSIGKIFTKAFAQNDENTPAWLEISPLDGCAKFKRKIIADNIGPILSNRFREIKIDIGKKIKEFQDKTQKESQDSLDKTFDDLTSKKKAGIHESILDNVIKEFWKQKWILEEDPALQTIEYAADMLETLGNAKLGSNITFGLFGGDIDATLDNKIAELTRWLCNGFQYKLGKDRKLTQWTNSCSWIPVLSNLPWNMAFLSPWDMQVMWCKIFTDKGIPAFNFPGNRPTGIPPYLPLPWIFWLPQKWPKDDFYGVSGGPYSSMMRVYLSPTLTAKLGIGICFWPYGLNLPKPFRDIAGNCIVFAVDPWIGKCKPDPTMIDKPSSLTPDVKYYDDANVCNDDLNRVRKWPLKIVETAINSTDNRLESIQGEYGLVVKLWGHANLTNYDSLSLSDFFSKVRLEWWNPLDLKIKWPLDKWLVSCLMNQFVDNQIRYLVNNLTTLNLTVILPDIKWLWEQVIGIWSVISDPIKSDEYRDLQKDTTKILATNKNFLSKQQLTKRLDTSLANPFDTLEVLFNQSELIHISSRDVLVELPFIYTEDIASAKGILTTWLERNKPIRKAWSDLGTDLIKRCDDKNLDQLERYNCQQAANSILQVNNQLGQFERSVRQNIETLELYGQLPKQVYELLHGYDRYIYDVFNFAYGTIDTVTAWLSKIARWFDAWIDFIISLSGIFKSRQILIDFSVNRKEKCSKCTVDNYSAYSCSFSKFCPRLPVFAIPPFKIPSITLDLSNIDFSTDIILPRLRFQPRSIGVIDNLLQFGIPDTPYPPALWWIWHAQIALSLPKLPIIPNPPDLSAISLPSFIPQIAFKGPTMPPAPRIPKIAPELSLAIDVADFLWRILCIVKWWIGLVGEKWLKSKIEQITQRTRQVEPFDTLKVLIPKPPLQTRNLFKSHQAAGGSFDLKLESFVNIRMYFDGIYGLVDGIAHTINQWTQKILRDSDQLPWVQEVVNTVKKWYNTIDNTLEKYDTTDINININPFGYESDYHIINHKIATDLASFVIKDTQPHHEERKYIAAQIKNSYTLPTSTTVNYDGIDSLKNDVSTIFQKELDHNAKTQEHVLQDYDSWLKEIVDTQYVSNDSLDISLKTSFLNLDNKTLSYLKSTDLVSEYLTTQKTVVDGYSKALQHSDNLILGMNKSDYDQSRDYMLDLQEKLDTTQNQYLATKSSRSSSPVEETNTVTCTLCDKKKSLPLLAQNPPSPVPPNEPLSAATVDPSAHINWYFVHGDDDNYYNVIANIPKGEELSKTLFEKDLDNDGWRELISRDQHTIYIKRSQRSHRKTTKSSNSDVVRYSFDSYDDIIKKVDEYGYSDDMKIYSDERMPKERKVSWQAYQSMTYSVDPEFDTNNGLIGYIVRYTDSIHGAISKDASYNYLIVLDQSLQGTPIYDVDIDGLNIDPKKVTLQYVDRNQTSLSMILSNIPRRWYFTQVAKLKMSENTNPLVILRTFFFPESNRSLKKSSPWSLYETAGMQIIADNSAPYLDIQLYREKKNISVSQSDTMYGTIKTYYNLKGLRYDDSKVVKNRILDSNNKLIVSQNNDQVYLPDIYSDKPITYTYKLVGEDAAWNIAQKIVTVHLNLPELSLDNVSTDTIGQSQAITNLNVDLDTGSLSYIRIRNGIESILQSMITKQSLFDTTTNQYTVTGWTFWFKQDRWFYDAWGKYLNVSITPQGQIINTNSSLSILVDFIDNVPKISLQQWWSELYRIYLKAKSFDAKKDIILSNGWYEIISLPNNAQQLGQFTNGTCVKPKEWVCEIMISPQWFIFVGKPYHRIYSADYWFQDGKVVYTIKKWNAAIVSIKTTVEPVAQ